MNKCVVFSICIISGMWVVLGKCAYFWEVGFLDLEGNIVFIFYLNKVLLGLGIY